METTPPTEPPRPPEQSDFLEVCRSLNAHAAKYVVVGGMAVLHHGYLRATEDIDLLVDASRENVEKIRRALEILPDKAIREMDAGDLERYAVVRIADAVIVDLMLKTAGISYAAASDEIEWAEIEAVRIPFASAELLYRMKQTGREKDQLDLLFLRRKLGRS